MPRLTDEQRIEWLLTEQLHYLKIIDGRLATTNELLQQLVDAQAPPTFSGTVGATVRITS